jgi:leucyl aminopeptidase
MMPQPRRRQCRPSNPPRGALAAIPPMTVHLRKPAAGSVPVFVTEGARFDKATQALPANQRQWLSTLGFRGAPDTLCAAAGRRRPAGRPSGPGCSTASHPYALALAATCAAGGPLPPGRCRRRGVALDPHAAALSWQLGGYQFDRYKPRARPAAELHLASSPAAQRGLLLAEATTLVRNLVNTPAEDLGPEPNWQLVGAGSSPRRMAPRFSQVVGDALLKPRASRPSTPWAARPRPAASRA